MVHRRARRIGVAAAVLALAGLLSGCEIPIVLWVDSTVDAPDAAVGDGSCATSGGECTLRAAVQEANTAAGPVRIELAADATYLLTVAGRGEDAAASGDLDLAGDLHVAGHGATIDADGIDRVLEVTGGANVRLDEVTITGGHEQFAGGIRVNAGTAATITRSTVTANTADGFTRCYMLDYMVGEVPDGAYCSTETQPFEFYGFSPPGTGPIYVHVGEGGGAGIWNRGTLAVADSTISDNVVPAIPETDFGAAECTTFIRVQICDLHAGSGLLNFATADLVNVTLSGNTIDDGFGAAVAEGPWTTRTPYPPSDPATTLAFVTIADNSSTAPGGPTQPFVFFPWEVTGSAVVGSVRAGATVIDGAGTLCSTSLAPLSLGSNVASDSSCFDPAAVTSDRNDTPSGLGPLAPNGGPTRTHLPLAGSALIDSIPACSELLDHDQRGSPRTVGVPCTIGAVEP